MSNGIVHIPYALNSAFFDWYVIEGRIVAVNNKPLTMQLNRDGSFTEVQEIKRDGSNDEILLP